MKITKSELKQFIIDEFKVVGGVGDPNLINQIGQTPTSPQLGSVATQGSAAATAGSPDDLKQIFSNLNKIRPALLKMVAKGLKNPIDVTKMLKFYADQKNLNSLLAYFAKELTAEVPANSTDEQVIEYLNKNTEALIQLGIKHYNSATAQGVKMERRNKITKTQLKQIIKEELDESLGGMRPTKPEYSHVSGKGYVDAPAGMQPQPKTYAINNDVIAAVDDDGRVEVYTGADPKGVLDLLKRLGYTYANFPVGGPA